MAVSLIKIKSSCHDSPTVDQQDVKPSGGCLITQKVIGTIKPQVFLNFFFFTLYSFLLSFPVTPYYIMRFLSLVAVATALASSAVAASKHSVLTYTVSCKTTYIVQNGDTVRIISMRALKNSL